MAADRLDRGSGASGLSDRSGTPVEEDPGTEAGGSKGTKERKEETPGRGDAAGDGKCRRSTRIRAAGV